MAHTDDHDWLALLTGQSLPEANPATAREAAALRAAILAEHTGFEDAADTTAAADRLLFRLKQEGLLAPQPPSRWGPAKIWPLLVAGMIVVVLVPRLMRQDRSFSPSLPVPAVPGALPKTFTLPQVVYTAQPRQQADGLQAALEALHLQVQRQDRTDSHLLVVHIPPATAASVLKILQPYALTLPADGWLRVEIVPAGG
jgi:hypothetical protein